MRFPVILGVLAMCAATLPGARKVVSPSTSASNEQVDIIASISLTEDEVTQKLGEDAGPGVVLLDVRVVPKTDKPLRITPDDFILLAHDDGQRSQPFDPSELAGEGAMVESVKTADPGKKTSAMVGFGGMIGGGGGASPGNPKQTTVNAKMDTKSEGNPNLLKALKKNQLPTAESVEPVEGYLYFRLDGKHKLKNLTVMYRGAAGKLDLEFQH
ncbi:MAG: hypothetical protein JO340_20275 [Acidobacteriaceae bacterium]|nr:hypothetical protein [Acidobacteriaceae bacterium]